MSAAFHLNEKASRGEDIAIIMKYIFLILDVCLFRTLKITYNSQNPVETGHQIKPIEAIFPSLPKN